MKPRDIMSGLTAEVLRQLFKYEPNSGCFFRTSTNNQHLVGNEAGAIDNTGYRRITIKGRRYVAHRLVWLYMTGKWPSNQIDHINLDRADNRWNNLREATNSQNKKNGRPYKTSKSRIKGVRLHEGGRFQVRITKGNGQTKYLGSFDTEEQAAAVYRAAALEKNDEFLRIE